jgi:PKD repeat protein
VTVAAGCNISATWSYTLHGDSVHFVSAGTNTTAHYYWNFGDGVTAAGYSPTHVYAGPGTYHVCQYVYIPNSNCYDSSCNTIVVAATCHANAAWQYYAHGDTVYFFSANNDSTIHLNWNAGDGSSLFGQHPTHVYAGPGTYHVCLYAYNANCIDSFCNTVTIGAGCHITATWNYAHFGDSLHFSSVDTNRAAHHYWNFGDGSNYGSGLDVSHVYPGPGTYHVCSYAYIPGTTCIDSSCNNVIVDSTCRVTAAWIYYGVRDSVYFIAADTNAGVHLYWNFGDGSTASGNHIWHVYAHAASYHVCLFAYTGTNCIDSFCYTVTVGAPHINSAWSYVVNGDTVYFNGVDTTSGANHYWSYGDGTFSGGFNSAHQYAAPGTYNVCYYVYIPNSNSYDSTCNTITINGTCNLAAAWNFIHSAGDTFHFYSTVQDSNTYMVWAFGDGTGTSGTYVSHQFPARGTYHVCVMAYIPGTPCSDSLCVDVNTALGITDVGTYPTISLSPNPFNQYTIMNIDGAASAYEVRIYDLVGQLIRTDRGANHSVRIDRGSLTSGMYIYSVIAGNTVIGTGKMSVE